VNPIVLDTNIVLDLWLFDDAAAKPLRAQLEGGQWQWLATQSMRDELERVLAYTHIVPKLAYYGLTPQALLARFDEQATLRDAAPKATAVCKDPDDQKFIDLAVANKAVLLSKDKAVLCMRKRLLAHGVSARAAIE
jgi:putative PIN family toxin of toxin-antitoxin system